MLEESRQRFKFQLQKEVSAQSQMTQEQYDKDKNPFYESGESQAWWFCLSIIANNAMHQLPMIFWLIINQFVDATLIISTRL